MFPINPVQVLSVWKCCILSLVVPATGCKKKKKRKGECVTRKPP